MRTYRLLRCCEEGDLLRWSAMLQACDQFLTYVKAASKIAVKCPTNSHTKLRSGAASEVRVEQIALGRQVIASPNALGLTIHALLFGTSG
jgi:hypothetical protein